MKKNQVFATTVFAAFLSTMFFSPAFADRQNVGTSAAAFLKIGAGARPAAMGETQTAVSDDVNSIFHNPAGLASVGGFEFTAQYGMYFQSMGYNVLGAAYSVDKIGTFGIGVVNLAVGAIERRTQDAAAAEGDFAAGDYAYVLSYARKVCERVSAGANVKYLYSTIDDISASAVAADAGIIARPLDGSPLSVGAAAQNLGGEMKFDAAGDPLPAVYKLGVGYRFFGEDLLTAVDVAWPRDNAARVSAGLEYFRRFDDNLAGSLRAGYRSVTDEKLDGLAGFSAGFGATFRQFKFDFAWVPYGLLGDSFRYALSLKF